ncbi:hypothetical protein PCANC_22398 [Puccinia coronata f. sp. avenae]|uniref:BRO1 domain-containing protein n=1 Tax=Puccinia coronata f. sp. avenae TaxID=200324 RepID=A0A2N5TKW6_9BASI|nr:hypothetical protein PCANC_22398 [Puccinia coronata f. sp. avenae]
MPNLLDCPLKITSPADLAQGLLNYIQSYHEDHVSHPEALKPDLELIKSYRTPIEGKLNTNQATLNSLIRYHAHLVHILPKFPDDVGVEFTYSTIFSASTMAASILPGELPSCLPTQLANLKYERACVLFNIAAMNMSLGTSHPRTNTDQLKRAVGLFQQAAGCFRLLKDDIVPTIELPPGSPKPPSPDLSDSCLSALEHLSLSQAQELVWQQAVKDQKSNGTISKIAQETGRLYHATWSFMKEVPKLDIHWIGFAFPEDWINVVQLKSAHFLAVAQFRKGQDDSAAREYGIEVGRLEHACSILKAAISAAKSSTTETSKIVLQEAKNVFVKFQKALDLAKRDNDLIYLKHVPSEGELPDIKPVSLVKSTVPNNVSNPSEFLSDDQFGKKLFEQVLPYQVYRIKGVYEDRKKDHIKSLIQDQADSMDTELVDDLRSMNLPGSLEALERPITLPPSLIRSSEELRQQNAPQMLISMLASVEQASRANSKALEQITMLLNDEAQEDQQQRTRFGTQLWQRPASELANRELREQEAQLLHTFSSATQSDRSVKKRYEDWRNAIEILCQDEETIRKAIPPLNLTDRSTQDLSLPPTGEGELSSPRQLRKLLDDLEDLRGARRRIVDSALHLSSHDELDRDLIEQFNRDLESKAKPARHLGSVEVADDERIERFIEKQLEKYAPFHEQLDANRVSQKVMVHRIRKVNQEFLRLRSNDPVTRARENVLQELDSAYHEFHSIIHNLQEGLQFHSQFNKYTTILRNQVDSYLSDRRRHAVGLEKQLDNLRLGDTEDHPPQEEPRRSHKANGKQKMEELDGGGGGGGGPSSSSAYHSHQKKRVVHSDAYDPKIHGPPVFSD